jgi:hypothetical protein
MLPLESLAATANPLAFCPNPKSADAFPGAGTFGIVVDPSSLWEKLTMLFRLFNAEFDSHTERAYVEFR